MAQRSRSGAASAKTSLVIAFVALAFCGSGCDSKPRADTQPDVGSIQKPSTPEPTQPAELVTLIVFAASSLTRPFQALESEFEAAHPGSDLVYHFAGTQELRTQIEQGARADVFASADERYMTALVLGGHVASPVAFATNHLVIAVHSEAKSKVQSFPDLAGPGRLVLGAPEVPVGRYSELVLEKAAPRWGQDFPTRVLQRVISRELNVKQVLAKVQLGEADAGIVYGSDISSTTPNVSAVPIPSEFNVIASYPIAITKSSSSLSLAQAFIALVLSSSGQRILAGAGFGPALQAGQAPAISPGLAPSTAKSDAPHSKGEPAP